MTLTTTAPAGRPTTSPLAKLMAAVRSEYRSDVLTPPEGHPLVDLGSCRIQGCPGVAAAARGLCVAHADRWYRARRRGVVFDAWLLTCPPRCTPQACLVPDCRRGQHRSRLCHTHHGQWTGTSGSISAEQWARSVTLPVDETPATCRVQGCDLWASFSAGFCISHQGRLNAFRRRTGIHDPQAFIAAAALSGVPRIDVTGLPAQLKLEVQYLVQLFLDNGPRRVSLSRWNFAIRGVHALDATSLVEHTPDEWISLLRLGKGNADAALFFRWGCDQLDQLLNGTGWDREYPLDTWNLDHVGHAVPDAARIAFTSVTQPWLKELVKRWARHRLNIGINPPSVRDAVRTIGRFSTHLTGLDQPPREACELSRAMVQSWCESLTRDHPAPRARVRLITSLSTFLRDVHQQGWAPTLPATTVVFSDDFPVLRDKGPKRALSEYVMAQLESEQAMAKLTNPQYQVMVWILIRCGLRAGDCRRLAFDCLIHDADGHPYLQYLNHKMKRTAFVPLDEDLAERIRQQQHRVLERYGPPRPGLLLFPGQAANPHGTKPYPASGFRSAFQVWLADLHVTDEQGQPVWITPHQLRHTFGTRLINRDVPQHIVQQLLDHSSADMTAHYARLHDKTIRQAWAKAQLLDAHGNPVDDHPLVVAAWARQGLDRAKQTLPNGYCGMPLNSPCEHANPCLTCPMFITNAEFLPQHEAQLRATLDLIEASQQHGHQRIVEKNQEILGNLRRIVAACKHNNRPEANRDAC